VTPLQSPHKRPHAHWSQFHPADGPCTGCPKDVVRVAIYQYVVLETGPVKVPSLTREMR
jgi:hypothetical protein